jgi:hypothetical protein
MSRPKLKPSDYIHTGIMQCVMAPVGFGPRSLYLSHSFVLFLVVLPVRLLLRYRQPRFFCIKIPTYRVGLKAQNTHEMMFIATSLTIKINKTPGNDRSYMKRKMQQYKYKKWLMAWPVMAGLLALMGWKVVEIGVPNRPVFYRYYAVRTGMEWVWLTSAPKGIIYSIPFPGASCTVTTTVAPASLGDYQGTYFPGRKKEPAKPTNFVYGY